MNTSRYFLLILCLSGFTQSCLAWKVQSITSIQEAINLHIASNLTKNADYKIRHSQLDKRLELPQCRKPLTIFSHTQNIKPGRNTIGVKCISEKNWTIYTSVNIQLYKNVIVLSQAVRRGEIFNLHSVHLEKREISTLRSGFIVSPESMIDKQAKRNMAAGTVITQSSFVVAKTIKRGEKVYITSNSQNLNISMAGIAMMDGIKGQNIRVKNLKSQQIVHGIVTQRGQVVVPF